MEKYYSLHLQQSQLAGASNRFRAPLNLQFIKDSPIMSLNGIQSEEKSFPDLVVGEPFGDELQHFQFAWSQWLEQRTRAQG